MAVLIVVLFVFVSSFVTCIPFALDHFGRHDRLMACYRMGAIRLYLPG